MINAQKKINRVDVKEGDGEMRYFRLDAQKALSEEMAFELSLEVSTEPAQMS